MEENKLPTQEELRVFETPDPPPSPASNPIKKTGKYSIRAIISTIIFLLLAGGAAAGFVYREQIITLVKNPIPSPVPAVNTLTPSPNATDNWEEFLDNETGLSFKYPAHYILETGNAQNIFATLVSPHDTNKEKTQNLSDYELKLEFLTPVKTTKALEVIIEEEKEKLNANGEKVEYQQLDLKAGDLSMAVLTSKDSEIAYFVNDGMLFQIVRYPTESFRDQEFMLILSTIKFTETIDTTTWKTYTNKARNYSFKYPTDWEVSEESDVNYPNLITNSIIKAKSIKISFQPGVIGFGGYCNPDASNYLHHEELTVFGKKAYLFFEESDQNNIVKYAFIAGSDDTHCPRLFDVPQVGVPIEGGKRNGSEIFNISYQDTTQRTENEFKTPNFEIAKKILSTFKFTD